MNDTQSALKRAIEDRKSSAGAKTIWITSEHYAWWNPTLRAWCLMTKDCLDGPDVRMPSWWSPEQRDAWRVPGVSAPFIDQREADRTARSYGQRSPAYRITADLETGAEVPA